MKNDVLDLMNNFLNFYEMVLNNEERYRFIKVTMPETLFKNSLRYLKIMSTIIETYNKSFHEIKEENIK